MSEFDVVCILEVKPISPIEIRQLREKEHVSQAVFAAIDPGSALAAQDRIERRR